jgi:Aspartyl/Asparaginyl beta-hydroxylase
MEDRNDGPASVPQSIPYQLYCRNDLWRCIGLPGPVDQVDRADCIVKLSPFLQQPADVVSAVGCRRFPLSAWDSLICESFHLCKDDLDDGSGDVNTIRFPTNLDGMWLQQSGSGKKREQQEGNTGTTRRSLLGFEDFFPERNDCDEQQEMDVVVFGIEGVSLAGNANRLELRPPHSDWARVDEKHDRLLVNGKTRAPLVHWVDMRATAESPLNGAGTFEAADLSLESIVYFLRSLLLPLSRSHHHDLSPWQPPLEENEVNGAQAPDAVVVVLPVCFPTPDFVHRWEQVRVGDICPSWYLHAVGPAGIIASPITGDYLFQWPWEITEPNGLSQQVSSIEGTVLLVYRRLQPRPHLTLKHPENGAAARPGCRWEAMLVDCPSEPSNSPDTVPLLTTAWRMVSPPYICTDQDYPQLKDYLLLPEVLASLRQEALTISKWTAWPESQHYRTAKNRRPQAEPSRNEGELSSDPGTNNENPSEPSEQNSSDSRPIVDDEVPWHVFPLCYCFPANDLTQKTWTNVCSYVPNTVKLLQGLGDNLRTALFSRLDPESCLDAHTGWEDLANYVYRLHIPLTVPGDDRQAGLCGTWVR